jgi:hypothetical protein
MATVIVNNYTSPVTTKVKFKSAGAVAAFRSNI